MALFSPPAVVIRDLLKEHPQHALTGLYRGFSRFMFEDLAFHPDFSGQTTSQRKKSAEGVAREMILRNQAYSRLVERVLPMHIRLSIHAHDSAGPKYPVQLLTCRSLADNLSDLVQACTDSQAIQDTLHIPTPWHNTVAEMYLDRHNEECNLKGELVICKASSLIRSAQMLIGGYDRNHPRGGRFVFWSNPENSAKLAHTFDEGTANPEIAVNKEDFRLEERYDHSRPSAKPVVLIR